MGAAFNCVIVPEKIQTQKDLQKFYEDYRDKLLEKHGEEFEGYTGDMCVDDGYLVIKKDLKLEVKSKKEIKQKDIEKYWSNLLELCNGHCEKWGPSIAVRIDNQWVICGSYSD